MSKKIKGLQKKDKLLQEVMLILTLTIMLAFTLTFRHANPMHFGSQAVVAESRGAFAQCVSAASALIAGGSIESVQLYLLRAQCMFGQNDSHS